METNTSRGFPVHDRRRPQLVDEQSLTKNPEVDSGRGRDADTPAEIPARGWKDIAYRIYQGISEDRIVAISAGVTFFVLLALFPGIAGLISLYGLFADSTSVGQHLQTLSGVLPEGTTQIIGIKSSD